MLASVELEHLLTQAVATSVPSAVCMQQFLVCQTST